MASADEGWYCMGMVHQRMRIIWILLFIKWQFRCYLGGLPRKLTIIVGYSKSEWSAIWILQRAICACSRPRIAQHSLVPAQNLRPWVHLFHLLEFGLRPIGPLGFEKISKLHLIVITHILRHGLPFHFQCIDLIPVVQHAAIIRTQPLLAVCS